MSGSPIHIPNAQETLEAPGSLRRFTPAQRSELAEQVLVDHLKDTHTELESRFEAAMTLRQRDKSIETMDRLIGLMEAGIAYHYTGDPALPDGLRSRSDFKAAYTFYDKQSAVFAAMALQGACVEQYSRLYELATEWATINNSLASSEKNELGLLVLAGNESLNIQAVVSFVAEACSNNERLENTRNAALRALVGVNSDVAAHTFLWALDRATDVSAHTDDSRALDQLVRVIGYLQVYRPLHEGLARVLESLHEVFEHQSFSEEVLRHNSESFFQDMKQLIYSTKEPIFGLGEEEAAKIRVNQSHLIAFKTRALLVETDLSELGSLLRQQDREAQ